MKILEIKTATNNNDEAKNIATALIKCHLIACAQIQKIESRYIWNDKFETTDEYLLCMKTTSKNKKQVVNFIKATHSYELPEISCTTADCSKEYATWVKQNTKNIIY